MDKKKILEIMDNYHCIVTTELADRCADELLAHFRTLVSESKPESITKEDVPNPHEVGVKATIPVAEACGYNKALDEYEKKLLKELKK